MSPEARSHAPHESSRRESTEVGGMKHICFLCGHHIDIGEPRSYRDGLTFHRQCEVRYTAAKIRLERLTRTAYGQHDALPEEETDE